MEFLQPRLYRLAGQSCCRNAETVGLLREQVARILRMLDTYRGAHVGPPDAHPTSDAAAVAAHLPTLLGYRLGARVSLTLEVPHALPRARIAPDRLEQILVNLVVNAIDAVEERGLPGGVIVRARPEAVGQVSLYVGDEGAGLHGGARDRLFSPYFTTKALARGTGLGLVICRELARTAGGTVRLCDEATVKRLAPWPHPIRTLFVVTLPAG